MYKFLLCSRYLRTRYIALTCVISVMLGVATMIVVNGVMSGFSTQMRSRIKAILADVVVETPSADGVSDPEAIMARIEQAAGEQIAAMSPTVEMYAMLSFEYVGIYHTRPVTLIGIDPAGKARLGSLTDNLLNFQPEVDEYGHEIGPPHYSRDTVPSFDLHVDDQKYRQKKIEARRWIDGQVTAGEQLQDEQSNADDPAGEDLFGLNDVFSEIDNPPIDPEDENTGIRDLSAPLKGRLYVGAGLLSFQDFADKKGGDRVTYRMIRPGDDVKISTVSAGRPPEAIHFPATVVDYFKCGMSEYDSNLVFCDLEFLQEARGMIDPETGISAITSVQIKLKDYADADQVVEKLQAAFPPGIFNIRTWESKQGPLLAAVAVESAILNVLLFLIIAVAGFGILAIFFMIVVEKTRDIGILKALGAGSGGVMSIFLAYGLGLGIVGSGAGVLLGLVFVWNINWIEGQLTWLTGIKVFDERIYYFPSIPTDIQPMMVFWVAAGAILIAVLASILPARRAARLHPVAALRYE